MSAVSVAQSPRAWHPDSSPRRKPLATPTAGPTVVPTGVADPRPVSVVALEAEAAAAAIVRKLDSGQGARISFAPGTAFHDRTRLRSRGQSKKVPANFNLRPVTSDGKMQQYRFTLPKATLPSLHYLSVSHEDFLDPRYAQDVVKTYGIPRYFFRSKSNLLTESANLLQKRDGSAGAPFTKHTFSSARQASADKARAAGRDEAEDEEEFKVEGDARPRTVDPNLSQRLPIVVPVADDDGAARPITRGVDVGGGFRLEQTMAGHTPSTTPNNNTQGMPLYKPLVGTKYAHARFCPPMNPFRSLQMESEVSKYVEHKKRVGLGRYVRFADKDSKSGIAREASMYDLKNAGPASRALDDALPKPQAVAGPFLRHRPRPGSRGGPGGMGGMAPRGDRSDLIITPRAPPRTPASNNPQASLTLKDMFP